MQSLDVRNPGLPDLQFVLLVIALCTSNLGSLNIPAPVRRQIFDRCWVLVKDVPPPERPEERVLDLRGGTETTLDALIETIRSVLGDAGISTITWGHPVSEPTLPSTPEARPLIERLQHFHPLADDPVDPEEKT